MPEFRVGQKVKTKNGLHGEVIQTFMNWAKVRISKPNMAFYVHKERPDFGKYMGMEDNESYDLHIDLSFNDAEKFTLED